MKRLTRKLPLLALLVLSSSIFLSAAPTQAQAALFEPSPIVAATNSKQDACQGLNQLGGGGCGGGQSKIDGIVSAVVNIISYIAGFIAIIMIIVSGIRFMTSNGDASKVSAAKTALIYALIGIAVVGLTQILVRLVLSTAAGA